MGILLKLIRRSPEQNHDVARNFSSCDLSECPGSDVSRIERAGRRQLVASFKNYESFFFFWYGCGLILAAVKAFMYLKNRDFNISFKAIFSIVSASFTLISCVHAQAATEEDLFFGDLPIVASASRLPQRLQDAPASVTVIDREMIKAMGMRDLNDVLRIVPGVQTYTRTIDPSRVTYHGLIDADQSSRIQVLIDGRSQFSPLFDGGVNWSLLPVALEDIERIEVTRGSNATSYGGNAFQALVNIVTADSSLSPGTTVLASHGNQGVRDYLLRHGGKIGADGDFRLTYQSKQDRGLDQTWTRIDGYKSQMLDGRADFIIAGDKNLQLSAGYMESLLPQSDGTGSLNSPYRNQKMSTAYFQAAFSKRWSENGETQLRYAFAEDKNSLHYNAITTELGPPIAFSYDPEGSRGTRHELELMHRDKLATDLRTVFGAGYRQENVSSPLYFQDSIERSRSVARLFGSLEWKPLRLLTLNFGLSVEDDSLVGVMPSSRASVNLHLDQNNTIRFGISSSERAGSRMNYEGGEYFHVGPYNVALRRGNPDLGVEKIRSMDVAYSGNWKSLGLQLDARVFKEHVPNRWFMLTRAYADCSPPRPALYCGYESGQALRTIFPVQDVHTRGSEYQIAWKPLDGTHLFFSQALTRIRAEFLPGAVSAINIDLDTLGDADKLDVLTEMSSPIRSTSLLLMQKLPYGFEFSAFGQWVGRMKWTRNSSVMAYNRVDFRLGYPFKFSGRSGEIALTAQSVDGGHYERRSSGGNEFLSVGDDPLLVTRRQWLTLRLDL